MPDVAEDFARRRLSRHTALIAVVVPAMLLAGCAPHPAPPPAPPPHPPRPSRQGGGGGARRPPPIPQALGPCADHFVRETPRPVPICGRRIDPQLPHTFKEQDGRAVGRF